MPSRMNSRSLMHPSCQQLSVPRIQLNCSDNGHKRSATHLLCHDQRSRGQCHLQATLLPLVKNAHALDRSTQSNGDTSFFTMRVPSTRVRRSVLHLAQEEGLAPSARPRRQPPKNLCLNPQTVASHQSCFFSVSCRCCTRCFLCTQLCNFATSILRISQLFLDPSDNFPRNIRTYVERATLVTIQHSDTARRRVFFSNKQWFTLPADEHLGRDISTFSSCCAENEITVTRNRLPVRDSLKPCRLSRLLSCSLPSFALLLSEHRGKTC